MVQAVAEDVRLAARRLTRAPGSTAIVAVTLALGIGATTALFSLIDALFLRPLPVRAPERLVVLYTVTKEGHELVAYPDFEDYRRARDVVAGLAAHRRLPLSISIRGSSERVWGETVSPGYFDLVGPEMALGRGLASGDADAQEVVLSHEFWRRRFAASPDALGQSIQIGGRLFTIAGVVGRTFHGTSGELGMASRTDMWLPVAYLGSDNPVWGRIFERRGAGGFEVTGRLAPGVSLAQAAGAVRSIADRLAGEHPATNRGRGATLVSGRTARLSPETRRTVGSFLGALAAGLGFLLLAACVNIAHVQLARGLARTGEMAVRAALGAGQARLAAHLLTEVALLSLAGLALSVPVALATQRLLARFALPFTTPLDFDMHLDARVLLFAGALAAVTAVGFGLLPALRATRPDLRSALHGPVVGAGYRRSRLAPVLVGLQVALSLALVVGTGLFARSLERAGRVDLGFRVDDVLVMNVDFNADRHRFDEQRAQRFYVEGLERVRAVPGVRAASWAGDVPLGTRRLIIGFFPEPRDAVSDEEWQVFNCDVVSPGYFQTLGIPLRGRDFTERDDQGVPEVAVVNESMARRYWPGVDPIGRRFKVRGRSGIRTVEVVGVAGDVRQRSVREAPTPRLYLGLLQRHFPEMALHVRVDGEPRRFLAPIRSALGTVEPELPVFTVRPLKDQVAGALSQARMAAALLGASALITLALAAVGVYGVTARAVAERRREMGIRIALGALPAEVLRLVLRQGLVPIAAGLVVGIGVALTIGRGVEAFLFDVPATDTPTYAASALLLVAVAGVALYLPARRIAALEPVAVLRHE